MTMHGHQIPKEVKGKSILNFLDKDNESDYLHYMDIGVVALIFQTGNILIFIIQKISINMTEVDINTP